MKKKVNFFCIIGILAGLAAIYFGYTFLSMYSGYSVDIKKYGADFYSDIYDATRVAGANIRTLANIVRQGFGYLLMLLGATDVCFFGYKLTDRQPIPAKPAAREETPESLSEELPEL